MKLLRLERKGFFRFPDVAAVDVADIPQGIVAVRGLNGHGKTATVDSGFAAPYLMFPSRDGGLADYATERDAYLDATYVIEGKGTFRCRVNVDGVKRTSDAVLEEVLPDGRHLPLNDGKVSTLKDAVAAVFPPRDLLLASAFASQNRAGSFVTLGKRERKDLFSALLGLKHYETMADTAKRASDECAKARIALETRAEVLSNATSEAALIDFQARANALQSRMGEWELRRRELRERLAALTAQREALQADVTVHHAAAARLATLETVVLTKHADLAGLAENEEAARHEAAARVRSGEVILQRVLAKIDAAASADTTTAAAEVAGIDERITANQALNTRATEIREAVETKARVEELLAQLYARQRALRADLDATRLDLARGEERVRTATAAAGTLADATRRATLLTTVPCGGAGTFASCQFLTDAMAAQARVPELTTSAAALDVAKADTEFLTTAVADIQSRLIDIEGEIAARDQQASAASTLAAYASELAATEERIAGYRAAIATIRHRLAERLAALDSQRADATADEAATRQEAATAVAIRLEGIAAQRARLGTGLTSDIAARDQAQADVERTRGAADTMSRVDADLSTERAALTDVEASLAAAGEQRKTLEAERYRVATQQAELADVRARLRAVEDEWLVWRELARIFGRDGLPTLEIDASGPTISTLVNDLLTVCFGPRFTLQLTTQVERADGKGMKEDFSIDVWDNACGGDARDIADLSGGERVIVEEALRCGIALYMNSRNQQPCRTIFRDESTGALDAENAERYVLMLRRMVELGGIAHCFLVTHNDDVAEMADAQLIVRDGQVTVHRPPFRRAA